MLCCFYIVVASSGRGSLATISQIFDQLNSGAAMQNQHVQLAASSPGGASIFPNITLTSPCYRITSRDELGFVVYVVHQACCLLACVYALTSVCNYLLIIFKSVRLHHVVLHVVDFNDV